MTGFLDIDLGAVVANWRHLSGLHAGETAAVVKADAYGLGMLPVAHALARAGCKSFFTAHLDEAVALRAALPDVRIMALNGLLPHAAADFFAQDITPVLGSLKEVALWSAEAKGLGQVLPCFLHLDTGMNRLGLTQAELVTLKAEPERLAGVQVEVVMSHLVAADAPENRLNEQQALKFYASALQFPNARKSLANSAGMFLSPFFHTSLARPGAALYGVNPTPGRRNPMKPAVKLTAPVLQIHDLPVGETVGYAGSWKAERPSRVATIGVGYADGYSRALANRAHAWFEGQMVPLVGRVSMDLATFDVTDIQINQGDLLTLLGPDHGVDDLASEARTSGYEILTSLGRRYQRRYLGA
ncbi:alanine racemase [Acidocella sp.]|uniref:alanine racemase n=1 Tax=Acidocella sp. TaxID=50710 RepID=UPI002610F3AC|nr:alanine racemase [Acidocella sp.]